MQWPTTARYAATAPMKKHHFNSAILTCTCHINLRLMQRNLRRNISNILAAIRVPNHHSLHTTALLKRNAVLLHRQQRTHGGACLLKMRQRLKQRHNFEPEMAPGKPRKEECRHNMCWTSSHRNYERPNQIHPKHCLNPRQHSKQLQHFYCVRTQVACILHEPRPSPHLPNKHRNLRGIAH